MSKESCISQCRIATDYDFLKKNRTNLNSRAQSQAASVRKSIVIKVFFAVIIAGTILTNSVGITSASVVINEVFPNPSGVPSEPTEFVELYNKTDSEINLSGYVLREAKTYVIGDVVIEPNGFVSFMRSETSLALNNNGDTITLLNPDGEELDSFTYTITIEDYSWSRYPDGTGDFTNVSNVTMDLPNAPPPSPTPTSIPTSLPTPVNVFSPTPSPQPVVTTPPRPSVRISPTTKPLLSPSPVDINILAIETEDTDQYTFPSTYQSEESTKIDSQQSQLERSYLGPIFIVIGGVIFIIAGFLYYLRTKD